MYCKLHQIACELLLIFYTQSQLLYDAEDSLTIIQDTKWLILAFRGLLSSNALHVHDCLIFVLHGTALYKHYATEKPPMCMILNPKIGWTPLLSTLKGHANFVESVIFSLSSHRMAAVLQAVLMTKQ